MGKPMHSVWKEDDGYKLQCPKGILTFKRKRDAVAFSDAAKRADKK
jgi:hypothetical protein